MFPYLIINWLICLTLFSYFFYSGLKPIKRKKKIHGYHCNKSILVNMSNGEFSYYRWHIRVINFNVWFFIFLRAYMYWSQVIMLLIKTSVVPFLANVLDNINNGMFWVSYLMNETQQKPLLTSLCYFKKKLYLCYPILPVLFYSFTKLYKFLFLGTKLSHIEK